MTKDPRIESLLARYVERRLAEEDAPAAADLCRDCPELLERLQAGIARYEALVDELPDTRVDAGLLAARRSGLRSAGPTAERAAAGAGAVPPEPGLAPGEILGGRYQIRSLLGRGGMGEVWLAFDLKLRVEIALKSLLPELFESDERRELLRREVRLARQVISPHVCRVFDLAVEDRHELLSMEYIDGQTLAELLEKSGPFEMRAAAEVASQFLAGLAGIHQAGLVHRDLKPHNLMITRSGRVVVMDLGLAKTVASGDGTMAGSPAYMSPEQLEGKAVDARSDIFSAGVVLAEMVAREGRRALLAGIREDPPLLPDAPWRPVLQRALATDPEERYGSARRLAIALEEVNLRVEGAEDRRPYPGLEAFTENDAQHFFGREVEIERLWRKLANGHLLAVVGPSGAGKTSFLRAGLVPARPEGWRCLFCRPGEAPFVALAQALVPELTADTDAMRALLRFEDPELAVEVVARWRQQHREVLLVVDQFEELFTLNPHEVEGRFAELLGQLAVEADVHLLLAMRDDFLFRCHDHPALSPILSELTLLGPPTGAALRRALVQPALSCGYRFEDEEMVEEMLAAVAGERGALPLLAFAAARLWERRHREGGQLMRAAYEEMGGVTGALAGHAEETLKRIGSERQGVVRELFRNLVTAQGTRASRDREELLSVFEDRAAAAVLDQLVENRLLTTYEVDLAGGEQPTPQHRVEIVHESLLQAWPRLVRWQTQDADSVQLRDQLRQSARLWEERGRSDDLLWTGTPFREYRLWRERYPGGLTEVEEAFAAAMEEKAGRQRRRRRLAAISAFVVLLTILATVGLFWRRAVDQARRAAAAQLLALGRLELDAYPTAALAYALASLELSDDENTRQLALEALGRGPPAVPVEGRAVQNAPSALDFSTDGRWLAVGSFDGSVRLWSRAGGGPTIFEPPHQGAVREVQFGADASLMMSAGFGDGIVRIWRVPDGEPLRSVRAERAWIRPDPAGGERLITAAVEDGIAGRDGRLRLEARSLQSGDSRLLGHVPGWVGAIDVNGRSLAYTDQEGGLWVVPIDALSTWPGRLIGRHGGGLQTVRLHPDGEHLFSGGSSGEPRLWSLSAGGTEPLPLLRGRGHESSLLHLAVDPQGVRMASASLDQTVRVWDLEGPPDADPLVLRRGEVLRTIEAEFDPSGRWLATTDAGGTALWRLGDRNASVLHGHTATVWGLAFGPDGSWLASASADGTIRVWPLTAGSGEGGRILLRGDPLLSLGVGPEGRYLVAGSDRGQVYVLPMRDGEPRVFSDFENEVRAVTFGPRGRLVAAGGGGPNPRDHVIRIWDLETGEVRVLDPGDGAFRLSLQFTPEDRLVSAGPAGVRLWSPDDGTHEVLWSGEGLLYRSFLSDDGRRLLIGGADMERRLEGELILFDLETRQSTRLMAPGPLASSAALSGSAGIVVVGNWDGHLRVVPTAGNVPHLLFGHEGTIFSVAISPDEGWIATGDDRGVIRLWPMPEGTPLHTLPYPELLQRLRALTKIRVVGDEGSRTGYRLDAEPFRGWDDWP